MCMHTRTYTHTYTADLSNSSLSFIGDMEASPQAHPPLEEGPLDNSFMKETPSYNVQVKQKKMSRTTSIKQIVRALFVGLFFILNPTHSRRHLASCILLYNVTMCMMSPSMSLHIVWYHSIINFTDWSPLLFAGACKKECKEGGERKENEASSVFLKGRMGSSVSFRGSCCWSSTHQHEDETQPIPWWYGTAPPTW